MVMYPEIREYQSLKNKLDYDQRNRLSESIVAGFRRKGSIPGAYKPLWNHYQQRLQTYRKRNKLPQRCAALDNNQTF